MSQLHTCKVLWLYNEQLQLQKKKDQIFTDTLNKDKTHKRK